jgi:hypothetical protein
MRAYSLKKAKEIVRSFNELHTARPVAEQLNLPVADVRAILVWLEKYDRRKPRKNPDRPGQCALHARHSGGRSLDQLVVRAGHCQRQRAAACVNWPLHSALLACGGRKQWALPGDYGAGLSTIGSGASRTSRPARSDARRNCRARRRTAHGGNRRKSSAVALISIQGGELHGLAAGGGVLISALLPLADRAALMARPATAVAAVASVPPQAGSERRLHQRLWWKYENGCWYIWRPNVAQSNTAR